MSNFQIGDRVTVVTLEPEWAWANGLAATVIPEDTSDPARGEEDIFLQPDPVQATEDLTHAVRNVLDGFYWVERDLVPAV